jgi:aspartate/methionine/tyrosine aminotransferase
MNTMGMDVNQVLADIPPSFIRALNDRRRPSSINLGLGEPSIPPDRDLLEDGFRRFLSGNQGYTRNAGLQELRHHIAAHRVDLDVTADQILVTLGSQEAVFIGLGALLNPGDDVLVLDPAFNIYAPIARLFGGNPISVPMDPATGFALDSARVGAAMTPRTKAICVVSPGNPTGRALDERQARALAELADASGATLIVDEVYRELHHTQAPAFSPGQWTRRAVTVGGLSKSCAMTGLRIGWMFVPAYLYAAALKLHQLCATCAASFSQYVAVSAFENHALTRHRPRYTARLDVAMDAIRRHTGLTPPRPEGAFYILLDLRHLAIPTRQLAERLLDGEDTVMIPGEAFGHSAHGFLRISFAQEDSVVVEGIQRLGRLLNRLHGPA